MESFRRKEALLTLFAEISTGLKHITYKDRGGVPLIVHDPEEF